MIELLDAGSVQLVDVSPHPSTCPENRTAEYRIVQAARVSYGNDLKSVDEDARLLRYLIRNNHTSPLEMCSVTYRVVIPRAIALHFLRHRTGKFNEISQRYVTMPADNFYVPAPRLQSTRNHQGSDLKADIPVDVQTELDTLLTTARAQLASLHEVYEKLIHAGMAKEAARFILPGGEYTTLYMQFDLNNLIKMLRLRNDPEHAQYETYLYARAMQQLAEPYFPTVFQVVREMSSAVVFSAVEITALQSKVPLTSKTGQALLESKLRTAGIYDIF